MKEIKGNIWDFHERSWVVITTNGSVKRNGEVVMGRGVALQAKKKFPDLPKILGNCINGPIGNHVTLQPIFHLLTFPVKHNWYEKADLKLIKRSCEELLETVDILKPPFYMVRPGCGNGGLSWEKEVKPILEKYLDDRFIVVEKNRI